MESDVTKSSGGRRARGKGMQPEGERTAYKRLSETEIRESYTAR